MSSDDRSSPEKVPSVHVWPAHLAFLHQALPVGFPPNEPHKHQIEQQSAKNSYVIYI